MSADTVVVVFGGPRILGAWWLYLLICLVGGAVLGRLWFDR